MWSALRSDLKEFVSTVTEDTSNVLSKIDASFPDPDDEGQDTSQDEMATPHVQEALRRMTMRETFTAPLQVADNEDDAEGEDGDKDGDDEDDGAEVEKKQLAEYLESFDIEAKTDEISQLLETHPDTLKVMFEEIVPATVSYEHFWQAYFYRCDPDRIDRLWAAEDERARAARQAVMTAGISSVKNFLGGAVQAVSASGRPPFVMNTAVDEDDDDEEEEEEEELGWDDDDDLDDDGQEDSGEVESSMEQIEFSDQVTEKLQEEVKQALAERDLLQQTVELQHKEIAHLQSGKPDGGGGKNEEVEKLKMQLWEKDSELAAIKSSQMDTSRVETDADEKFGSLQKQVDLLTQKLQEKDSELSEMQTLMQNSMEELAQMMANREQDKAALDEALAKSSDKPELDATIQSLNEQVAALRSENETLRQGLDSAQGDSKSQSVELEQQLASSEKQVATLTMELDTLKGNLASAEERANATEGEMLSSKELLEAKAESEAKLEGELSAAKELLEAKKKSEARLEGELLAAKESLRKQEESAATLEAELRAAKEEEVAVSVSSSASPVKVEAPAVVEKIEGDSDEWGDDWGDDDE
jgi:hypothetical protein